MVLLRIVCQLILFIVGWDIFFYVVDISCEVDIVCVRYFMNIVFDYVDKVCVSDVVFVDYCENIWEMLVRFGGVCYGDVMDKIMYQKLDFIIKEYYKEFLKQWKKNEDCIKDKMNELEIVMELIGNEGEI